MHPPPSSSMASANSTDLNPEADPYCPLPIPVYDLQFQPFPFYVYSEFPMEVPLYAPFNCYEINCVDGKVIPPRVWSWQIKDGHRRCQNGQSTIMIKNIPNNFNRKKLLHILDWHCQDENEKAKFGGDPLKSEYDFVYLPMDFWYNANLGYAFVNFTNSAGAARCFKSFRNKKWDGNGNKKVCEIGWAKYQGKEKLVAHFKNSIFTCHNDCYMPAIFSPPRDGTTSSKLITVGKRADYLYRKPLKRSS